MTTAVSPATIPTVEWREFERDIWSYEQGQHVTLVGPTGHGKSTLGLHLLPRDLYPVLFRTKRHDVTLDKYTQGFKTVKRFEVHDPDVFPRVVLHPPLRRGLRSLEEQREIFRDALEAIFRQGGWTVYLDELAYLTDQLKLEPDVKLLLSQGRSLGCGVWSNVQRPRHVPLMAYDQAGHLFLWKNADLQVQDRLGELVGGSVDPDAVEAAISNLGYYEVLYVNTITEQMVRTEVEV